MLGNAHSAAEVSQTQEEKGGAGAGREGWSWSRKRRVELGQEEKVELGELSLLTDGYCS